MWLTLALAALLPPVFHSPATTILDDAFADGMSIGSETDGDVCNVTVPKGDPVKLENAEVSGVGKMTIE